MMSHLISKQRLQSMVTAKDMSSLLSILNQTNYSKMLSNYGGSNLKDSLIDFALSEDMAKSMASVMRLTPNSDKTILKGIIGRWDLHNIKIVLEAKATNSSYEKISSFIIDYGEHNKLAVKEIMKEDSIEHILQRFMINSNYSSILQEALNTYMKTKKVSDTINKINLLYYKSLSKSMRQLSTNGEIASRIIRLEIDMRNILTLIRGRALSLDYAQIQEAIIENGNLPQEELKKVFTSSDSMESMVSKITIFDLKTALTQYKKNKRIVGFEISMRSSIFKLALKTLTHSVLSLTTVIAYVYLKEIELSVLRAVIKSKEYNLNSDELSELIIWKE